MSLDWKVELDEDGHVVAGDGTARIEGRYLVVPQSDGSLALHALEHHHEPGAQPETPPPAPVEPPDEAAAAAELARWGARALGDLRPGDSSTPAVSVNGTLPLVEIRSEDRPQPAAQASAEPAANASALSAVDSTWRYWLVQNRDAHELFNQRSASSRRTVPASPAISDPKSPA
jgi:hypothetical protein